MKKHGTLGASLLLDASAQAIAGDALYDAVLKVANELIARDPLMDSVEGKILCKLSTAIEAYEKVVYPIGEKEGNTDGLREAGIAAEGDKR